MVLKKKIKRKVVLLTVGGKKYRYLELIEEILPDTVDLTMEDQPNTTRSESPPVEPNTRRPHSPSYAPTTPEYLNSPQYTPEYHSGTFEAHSTGPGACS